VIVKTFKQLQDDALRWFDEVDNEDELRDAVKQAINAAHVARLSERNWPFMKWKEPLTFSTEVGRRSYTLHQEFFKPIYFRNTTTQRWLREVSDGTFVAGGREDGWEPESLGVGLDVEGSATRFEIRGTSPVRSQPASTGVLSVQSTSTADGSSQTLIVKGELADGLVAEETLACGASGAQASGTVAFQTILRVTKGANAWNGTMTLKDSSGNTLLTLRSDEYGKVFRTLYLMAEPTAVEEIEYHFYRQPTPLVYDNDIPDIPAPFADLLVYDALIDLAGYNEVEPNALKVWDKRLTKLEQGLLEAFGEAQSLEREVEYVPYIARD
jgi:hypothetical protein